MSDQQATGPETAECASEASIQTLPQEDHPDRVYYLGIGVSCRSFDMGERKQGLGIGVRANRSVEDAEKLYELQENAFETADRREDVISAKKLYPPDHPSGPHADWYCQVTAGETGLGWDQSRTQYEARPVPNRDLNRHLGRALALHFKRSRRLVPPPEDPDPIVGGQIFDATAVTGPTGLAGNTELLGVKVFAFVDISLNDKPDIHEVIDGSLDKKRLSQRAYDERKLIAEYVIHRGYGGRQAIIPGVYQIYILLKLAPKAPENDPNGGFQLQEMYCDGDPLYLAPARR